MKLDTADLVAVFVNGLSRELAVVVDRAVTARAYGHAAFDRPDYTACGVAERIVRSDALRVTGMLISLYFRVAGDRSDDSAVII